MKKLLLALALGLLLVAALATVASADNGPHGSFTATTDACASCHRAHSAQYGSNSLLIMAPDLLCLSCHDGSGAGTNVVDGVYAQAGADTYYGGVGVTVEGTDGASLFAGGFTNTLMATAWSGAYTPNAAFDAVSRASTSHHNYDGTTGTVWGSGAVNTANDVYALECVSCHDPHGTAGWVVDGNTANGTDTRVRSYRLLRWQPSGSTGFTAPASTQNWSGGAFPISDMGTVGGTDTSGWLVPDNFAAIGTEWYTLGTTSAFAVGDYNAGNANDAYNPAGGGGHNYRLAAVNTAFFCAQCHDRYFNNSRLRNATDDSLYCGAPAAKTVNGVALTVYAPVGGVHPVDPVRCEPVYTGAVITAWGDNGESGDTTYMYRHASGDLRTSSDGTYNGAVNGTTGAFTGTASVSRSCVACHVAHGTSSSMTAFASDATLAVVAGADVDNSTLLRMDNRSLCLRCHAGTVNYTIAP